MIETDVPGRPGQIREAADWLDPATAEVARQAFDSALNRRTDAAQHWFGGSADLYMEHMDQLVDAAMEVRRWAQDVSEKMRSYAGQLERMSSDFADLRTQAENEGLVVNGTVIEFPVNPLGYSPNSSAPEEDQEVYDAYAEEVDLYNRIAGDVGQRWVEHDEWVEEHLLSFQTKIPAEPQAVQQRDALLDTAGIVQDLSLEVADRGTTQHVAQLLAEAAEHRGRGVEFREVLAQNDTIAAALRRADNPDITARGLEELADDIRGIGRAWPIIAIGAEALAIGLDIAGGRDPLETFIEAGGSVAGGAAAAAILAATVGTAPFWATAGVVVVGAVGGGALAAGIWEAAVPQDVREDWGAAVEDFLFHGPVYGVH